MRELKVEDALLYLDQVKVEFGDQPHIYNEFLDIMKTFKTQQIDTPGVIRRVSNLFQGNPRLVLGFNTFLPEGYKIELPDGDGPAIAVYRAPGSNVTHVLTEGVPHHPGVPSPPGAPGLAAQQQQQQRPPPPPAPRRGDMPYSAAMMPPHARAGPPSLGHPMDQPPPPKHGASHAAGLPVPHMAPHEPARAGYGGEAPAQPPQQQPSPQQPQPAPLEFDHAISYVTTIKKRFAHEPYTYKKFLEILHTYQKEQRGIKEVLDEVSALFADHPDLLKEFTYFLPDTVQAQAKAQLDAAAREAEDRKKQQRQSKGPRGTPTHIHRDDGLLRDGGRPSPPEYDRLAPPPQPFAQHGRTSEQEQDIIRGARHGVVSFAPVKPPRKNEPTPAQAATTKGRPTAVPELPVSPNTSEMAFFQRAKTHLHRPELQAEKPPNNKRHTPHAEFLKCLHLFGAGILTKEELLPLLKTLFLHGHAPKTTAANIPPAVLREGNELLREFEEILLGRGPFAGQESRLKDKSKYGGLRNRDFSLDNCEHPTPSYWAFPADYPQNLFLSNTGQSEEDRAVLNNAVMCIGQAASEAKAAFESPEAYDAVRMRRNVYEEIMFQLEDERYEVDMAIERNFQAMRQIEPLAEEVQALREQEEKDRQPIGRLQYQLNRYSLNTIHINAVGRLYGEKGDEVLQHLVENPFIVLPIIYQRLRQKDSEWRSIKIDLQERWNALQTANYEGTMDVRCVFYRRELERRFSVAMLEDECKRARTYCKYPERIKHSPIIDPFCPTYSMSCPDPGAVLYQPYSSVPCTVDVSHKDAIHLIMHFIQYNRNVKPFDRERIGRIWAEFMVPWFGYPAEWVAPEARESFGGKMNPSLVKYASGQRVMTSFGEGSILSFQDTRGSENSPKYRVKLPFGMSFLSPSAILYAIPSHEQPYVRRDGAMVRDDSIIERETSPNSSRLESHYKLLFGTDNVYLFVRLYSLVCSLLASTRQHHEPSTGPEALYHNDLRKEGDAEGHAAPSKVYYADALSALKKVLAKMMDASEFERIGRTLSKEYVHQFAALPRLIERCADALVSTAKEDCLLQLYDYCKYTQADPVVVRTRCYAVASEADYRIQRDTKLGTMYFNYLPKTSDLLTMPRQDNDRIEDYDGQDAADVPMDVDDPNQENDDTDDRPNKRARAE